jgi:hypothetical protein
MLLFVNFVCFVVMLFDMNNWLAFLRPGDWAVVGVAALAVAASFPLVWQGGAAEKAVVRRDGEIVAELDLARKRTLRVDGAIGVTVIAVEPGRARVAADPGPRQYCVRQGWLRRPGEIAICAPNHISLQIAGRRSSFDSITY